MTKRLLDWGLDVYATDEYGRSAVHFTSNVELLSHSLGYRPADPALQETYSGWTALHFATAGYEA
jgi:hypothetical protein